MRFIKAAKVVIWSFPGNKSKEVGLSAAASIQIRLMFVCCGRRRAPRWLLHSLYGPGPFSERLAGRDKRPSQLQHQPLRLVAMKD